ncbi:MAG: carbohydrate kinase, partial [Acidobacteria bacterium]|nr:carbohydrate kinase [Acidobacteriota bacterium]
MTLALDIGTSSIRAALFDGETRVIPRTSVKIEWSFSTVPDGGFEIDADLAFDQVIAAIDAVLDRSEKIDAAIEFVASCAFWHSIVGVDTKGKPTTPVIGWADIRSREYSHILKDRLDEKAVHDRTGAHFHSSFWPAKLMWLRKEFPDIWLATAKWLSFSDYVALKLSGDVVTSVSMASATGVFDQRKCDWDSEMIRYLKIDRKSLPMIAENGETFRLSRKFARRWPRLKDAEWFPAVGDGATDHVGSCGIDKNKASLMVGTSAAMRVAYEGEPPLKIPEGLWCYRIDRDRVIIGGALSDGGNLYRW